LTRCVCMFVCPRTSVIMATMGSASLPRLVKPSFGEVEGHAVDINYIGMHIGRYMSLLILVVL